MGKKQNKKKNKDSEREKSWTPQKENHKSLSLDKFKVATGGSHSP